MNKRLQKYLFDEVTIPDGLFLGQGVIAISHGYRAQFHARSLDLRAQCLSLYDEASLTLLAHFNKARYPINDVAFHPSKPRLLIATGDYDGGYLYEGELIFWDYEKSHYLSLLNNASKVIACRFIEENIEFTLSPMDEDCEEISTIYSISASANFPVSLDECQIKERLPYTESLYKSADLGLVEEINKYAKRVNKIYSPSAMAWDLVFIDEHTLAVGLTNGNIELWNIPESSCQLIKLAPQGDCAQLFYDAEHHQLTVNLMTWGNSSQIYQLDLVTHQSRRVCSGSFSLSRNQSGFFLARQTNFMTKGLDKDILFDWQFSPCWEKNLGHYDLFNHYIRIDDGENVFALVGNPRGQHKNKSIIEINARGDILSETVFDSGFERSSGTFKAAHYMDACAILLNGLFIIQAKRYPGQKNENFVLFCINRTSRELVWRRDFPNQVSAFCAHSDRLLACLITGEIYILNPLTGDITGKINKDNIYGAPLSMARFNNTLAVGYDDGTLELFSI